MTDAPAAPPPSPPLSPLRAMASRMYGRPAIVPDAQSAMGGPKPAAPAVPPKDDATPEAPQSPKAEMASRLYRGTEEKEAEKAEAEEAKRSEKMLSSYKIEAPEGFAIDPELAREITPEFRRLGLTDAGAQKMIEAGTKLIKSNNTALIKEYQAEISGWRKAAEAEFGPGMSAAVEDARHAIHTALPGPKERAALNQLLNGTGLGNHALLIKVLAAAGRAMRGGR